MQFSSLGDLAQNLLMRRQNAVLKNKFVELTAELSSGKKQDIGSAVRGNFTTLAAVERELAIGETYSLVRNEIRPKLEAFQNVFEAVRQTISGLGPELLSATSLGQQNTIDARLAEAPSAFDAVVSSLNSSVNGDHLLSGTRTDVPPLISSEEFLAELRPIALAATDEADFTAQIDDWFFSAGGGFETVGYLGSDAAATPISIDDNQSISSTITAESTELRALLRDLAVASLIAEGDVPFNQDTQNNLAANVGTNINQRLFDLVEFQATVGVSQEKLEVAEVQGEVERNSNATLKNSLVATDPFEVASRLEEVQIQLESLYLLTARTSRLSLTEYLR